jgi:hypothetical protein
MIGGRGAVARFLPAALQGVTIVEIVLALVLIGVILWATGHMVVH